MKTMSPAMVACEHTAAGRTNASDDIVLILPGVMNGSDRGGK